MKQNEMRIEYGLDCLAPAERQAMESKLRRLLHSHGWTFQGSGADVRKSRVRIRDIAFMHCPDTECVHWDGHSGCDAKECIN